MHPLEVATWALIVFSVISMLVTSISITSIIMIVRWALVTLVAVALMRLDNEDLAKFGRIFVYGSVLNALFGLYIVALDRDQSAFRYLRIFGYAPEYTAPPRFAYSEGGAVALIRLGGTSVDPPNGGEGIALAAALAVSFIVLRGWTRIWLTGILGLALLLTLSRASIFSVVVGFLLVLVFHKMRTRDRVLSLAGLSAVVVAAALTPRRSGNGSSARSPVTTAGGPPTASIRCANSRTPCRGIGGSGSVGTGPNTPTGIWRSCSTTCRMRRCSRFTAAGSSPESFS